MQWDLSHPADAVEAAERWEEKHGKRSDFFKDFPIFSFSQIRLWNAWSILHASRQLAFESYQNLSMTDIEVVGRIYQMDLEDFFNLIVSLDNVWITWFRKQE